MYFGYVNAVGYETDSNYVVLKGSIISEEENYKDGKSIYRGLRHYLIDQGIIKNGCFMKNYCFNSKAARDSVLNGKATDLTWHPYCNFGYKDILREVPKEELLIVKNMEL